MFRSNLKHPSSPRSRGFTLVELVVVVLILGILASVAAPRMFNTAGDARLNGTLQSLSVLRSAIELHQAQEGALPSIDLATDLADYLNGPFPATQIGTNQSNTVADASAQTPITTVVAGSDGWAYNPGTGEIRINDNLFINR